VTVGASIELARRGLVVALAGALTLVVARLLDVAEEYWAVISAIIVADALIGASLAAAGNRLLGTAIGAVFGVATLLLFGSGALSVALAVGLTFFACGLARLNASQRLACATAAIVVLLPSTTTWETGLNRFIDVVVGVGVAVIVSTVVFPIRGRRRLRERMAQALRELATSIRELVDAYLAGEAPPGRPQPVLRDAGIAELRSLLNASRREPAVRRIDEPALLDLIVRMVRECRRLRQLVADGVGDSYPAELADVLRRLAAGCVENLERAAAALEAKQTIEDPSDLEHAREAIDERMLHLRATGRNPQYPLDQVMRAMSFQYTLRLVSDYVDELPRTLTARRVWTDDGD
jgi:uncharacterized membrane protein YccC